MEIWFGEISNAMNIAVVTTFQKKTLQSTRPFFLEINEIQIVACFILLSDCSPNVPGAHCQLLFHSLFSHVDRISPYHFLLSFAESSRISEEMGSK